MFQWKIQFFYLLRKGIHYFKKSLHSYTVQHKFWRGNFSLDKFEESHTICQNFPFKILPVENFCDQCCIIYISTRFDFIHISTGFAFSYWSTIVLDGDVICIQYFILANKSRYMIHCSSYFSDGNWRYSIHIAFLCSQISLKCHNYTKHSIQKSTQTHHSTHDYSVC